MSGKLLLSQWLTAAGMTALSSGALAHNDAAFTHMPDGKRSLSLAADIGKTTPNRGETVMGALKKYGFITEITDGDGYKALSTNPGAIGFLNKAQMKDLQTVLADNNLAPSVMPKNMDAQIISYAINSVINPMSALATLTDDLLPKEELSQADIMAIQISLNTLDYEAGAVTGTVTKKTAEALEKFLLANTSEAEFIDEPLITAMGKHLDDDRMNILFENNDSYEPVVSASARGLARQTPDGFSLLNPELIDAMEKDERVRGWIDLTRKESLRRGLDPNMMANQFWQESISMIHGNPKKYSGPNPKIISWTKCCKGIAQFSKDTGKSYGLITDNDFFNPEKSIIAGVHHMADMKGKYGSQTLALVAYNGGPGAIEWGAKGTKLGKNLTAAAFVEYAKSRLTRTKVKGKKKKVVYASINSYARQTGPYITHIDSTFWPASKIERAHKYAMNTQRPQIELAKGAPDDDRIVNTFDDLSLREKRKFECKLLEKSISNSPDKTGDTGARETFNLRCIAPVSARFFEDASRRYPDVKKMDGPIVTPANPNPYKLQI